jgi:hypothetical protein
MLRGASYKQFSDNSAWHSLFRIQVVERVDELIFKPLYDETIDAPNSSARVLDKTSPAKLSGDDLTLLTEVSSTTGSKVVCCFLTKSYYLHSKLMFKQPYFL